MKLLLLLCCTILTAALLPGCMSADVQKQLDSLSAKQDSIINVLKTMENQTDFIAKKVGWEPPEDTMPKNIPLASSYYQGAEKPVMTVVEFTDFECPYCAQVAPVLDSLVRTYPNQVRVVFKHFPLNFHKQARSAHAAALAAGKQGRFFDYRYKLAKHFRSLSDSTYISVAQEIGLDVEEFKANMALTQEDEQIINRDLELGRELGVRGTPTLYANGKKVGDRSFAGFQQLLKSFGGNPG